MVFGLMLCKKTLEKFSDKQTEIHRVDGSRMTERELMVYYLIRVSLSLPFMIIAGLLAWRCNAKEPMYLRVLVTVLAAMFSTIYILL